MRIPTKRAELRVVSAEDAPHLRAYYIENARHLEPWEPARPPSFHTVEAWAERAAEMAVAHEAGLRIPLVASLYGEREIAGVVNISNIVRGVFQAGTLGYSVAARLEGQGIMHETLDAAIKHVFESVRLHRIMAAHLPENTRSARLLDRLGFEKEGYARDYLKIAGVWRDHVLTAKLNPEPI